jgi:membrane-associated phospholipid phosphatase
MPVRLGSAPSADASKAVETFPLPNSPLHSNVPSHQQPALAAPLQPLLRRSELVLIAYFTYTAIVGFLLRVALEIAVFTATLNLSLIAGYLLLGHADRTRPRHLLSILRDWLPLGLILLAYREMGWFAPAEHTYELEQSWIVWDRLLLRDWGLKAAIEFFGPLIPSILEISYTLVYAIGPLSVAVLYCYDRRSTVNRFLFPFLLGTVASYSLFPYFPSEPPRAVFPGEDVALHNVFRQFNWWLLGGHGIHTSVFPSAHVSSAFAAAFAMLRVMPERKWPGWFLMALASLIFVATVYGRYHYVVDGIAGVAVSLAALGATVYVERRWLERRSNNTLAPRSSIPQA